MLKHSLKLGAAVLAGSLAFSTPALAHFQPKDGDSQKFKIMIEDGQIGLYHVDFSVPQEGAILAKSTMLLKVEVMGKTLADVRAVSQELIWQGKFIEMQGVGQNGDEKFGIKMKAQTDGSLKVTQGAKETFTPVGTAPFSFWNKDTLDAQRIYDPVKQQASEIEPKEIRTENIRVLGERKECVKYKLKNPEGQSMYIWYGVEDEALCRIMVKAKKMKVVYVPYTE